MTIFTFDNPSKREVNVTIDGKVKAILEPNESVALNIREGARIGFVPIAEATVTPRPMVETPAPKAATPAAPNKPYVQREAKPVDQIKDGQVVHTFHSIGAAAAAADMGYWEFFRPLNDTGEVLAGGFTYRRSTGTPTPAPAPATKAPATTSRRYREGKPVLQLTQEGKPIKLWPSASQASDALKIDKASISKVCRGEYQSAGNYGWKFATA